MATVKSFEELEIWKLARVLCQDIFEVIRKEMFSRDFGLKNQINSSSGSIMDNIAEGFEREGTKEFLQFLAIAKGSAGECRSQLIRAYDRQYLSEDEFNDLANKTHLLMRKISNFMTYLRNTDLKGKKFPQKPQ